MSESFCNLIAIDYLDTKLLSEDYQLFTIRGDCGSYGIMSRAVDSIFETKGILSVVYDQWNNEKKPCIYALVKKGEVQPEQIMGYTEGSSSVYVDANTTFEKLRDYNEKWLIQLLFNSLKTPSIKSFRFNNLNGKCYICKENLTLRKNVQVLEYSIDSGYGGYYATVMSRNLVRVDQIDPTFASDSAKASLKYGPWFCIDKGILKRQYHKGDKSYIFTDPEKRKNTKYICIRDGQVDKSKFYHTRFYHYWSMIELFNEKFKKYCRISYIPVKEKSLLRNTNSFTKMLRLIKSSVFETNINIIDTVHDETSVLYCKSLSEAIEGYFNKKPIIVDVPEHGEINLVVVHEKKWYKKNDMELSDPYRLFPGYVLQHMTIENSKPYNRKIDKETSDKMGVANRSLLEVIIKELIIKRDLSIRKILFDDWSKRGFKDTVTFIRYLVKKEGDGHTIKVFSMHVDPTGDFCFDALSEERINELVELYSEKKLNKDDVIVNYLGRDMLIQMTKLRPILPQEAAHVYDENKEGITLLKSSEGKKELLYPLFNIRQVSINGQEYYSSSFAPGALMFESNAPAFYRIESLNGGMTFFDEIRDLLKVGFVKYKQATVLPFPFKYLNEHVDLLEKGLTPMD